MQPLDDSGSVREHARRYFLQSGTYPPGTEPLPCPEELEYVWRYWCSMHSRRSGNGFGPNPISYQEQVAWQWCHGIRLVSEEIEALDAIETAYFRSIPKPKVNKK